MMKKRFVTILLLLSMLTSVFFTSCSSSVPIDPSDTATETDTQQNDVLESVPETESEENKDEDQDIMENTRYQRVVVIGVDGAGAFFQNTDTPAIDRIFENGAITNHMLTANPTISAQCWGSLLHGVTPNWHGLTNSIAAARPYPSNSPFPSVFRVIREAMPEASLASFCHWNTINVGIVEDGIGVHKVGGLSDADLTDQICEYVLENDPTFLFVQFDEVDAAGHTYGYNTASQLTKIREIDSYIGSIYNAYAARGFLEDTLFIVTSDHGGNDKTHGGLTDAEKYVMFAASGKTVVKGTIGDIEIRDTAAIVLHALGLQAPNTWTARVPSNLFENVTASERPEYQDPDSDRTHVSVETPDAESEGYITNFIKDKPLSHYLTFDGTIADSCGTTTTDGGKLYYVDGYFGKGVSLDDGYVSIPNYSVGKNSFSVSLWIKTEGVVSDPAIFSNKNWNNGLGIGYVLSIRATGNDIKFNVGDGGNRMDVSYELPSDYTQGWMHVLLVVDREAGEIRFCYDFGELIVAKIPDTLKEDSFDGYNCLNIGQDGTGQYKVGLPATVDEFMIFDGVLTQEDVSSLASYYGIEK